MARLLYINADPSKQSRATTLGCGWMPAVPVVYEGRATAPCVIIDADGQVVVLAEPTTAAAVAQALAPLLASEQAKAAAKAALAASSETNADTIRARAQAALGKNDTFLALGAAPTAAQVRDQVIVLTKECTAVIRELYKLYDSVAGT